MGLDVADNARVSQGSKVKVIPDRVIIAHELHEHLCDAIQVTRRLVGFVMDEATINIVSEAVGRDTARTK